MTGKAPFSVMEVGLIHHGSHGWHCQDAGHAPITSSMAPTVGFSSSFTWKEPGIEHHQSRIQIYWNSRLMQVVSWQSSNWQLLQAPIPASEKPADWEQWRTKISKFSVNNSESDIKVVWDTSVLLLLGKLSSGNGSRFRFLNSWGLVCTVPVWITSIFPLMFCTMLWESTIVIIWCQTPPAELMWMAEEPALCQVKRYKYNN